MENAGGFRRRDRGNLREDQTQETKTVETSAGEPWDRGGVRGGRGKPWELPWENSGRLLETGRRTGAGGQVRPRRRLRENHKREQIYVYD